MSALALLGAAGSISGGKGGIKPSVATGMQKASVKSALSAMNRIGATVAPSLDFSGFYSGNQGTSNGLIDRVFDDNKKSMMMSPTMIMGGIILGIGTLWILNR